MDPFATLDELIERGVIQLGRGKVISKKDIAALPGEFPIYSSARENDGKFGEYGNFMFDEELITWSVDGGGNFFYRPRHKFSVTNVGGFLRILDKSVLGYRYLHYVLAYAHSKLTFDWITKAHPSVIRRLYSNIPTPSISVQARIVDLLSRAENIVRMRKEAEAKAKEIIPALFLDMFGDPGGNPKGWEEAALSDLVSIIVPTRDKPKSFSGEIPWITIPDMRFPYTTTASNLLSTAEATEVANRLMPAGTVLLSCAATLGKISVTTLPAYANQQLYGLVVKPGVLRPEFLAVNLLMKGDAFYRALAGTSTLGFFSKAKALSIRIFVPPIALQDQLCARVQDLEEWVKC